MSQVIVSASFDDLRSRDMRILQEAAKLGPVKVLLWSDAMVEAVTGKPPKFPESERHYFVDAIRYVDSISSVDHSGTGIPAEFATEGTTWVVTGETQSAADESFCQANGMTYQVLEEAELAGYPEPDVDDSDSTAKKVIVTGCYDWFHSGHVRFFEEVAELGDLYVVVGHDANIKLLKGEGHPMYLEDERRYMAGSIRFVKKSYVSTGDGWLDAEPQIEIVNPDMYAVNEDGDKPEKSEYCAAHGIEYVVLKRAPKEGLPKRQSTDLRGF